MNWNEYWKNLTEKHRLIEVIKQLDLADTATGRGAGFTEKTCKNVREDFLNKENQYSEVKSHFLKKIDSIPDIHSVGSRVKAVDSLLVKIITKRAEKYKANSTYVDLTEDDYGDIITDLIGIRLILHYQGQWKKFMNNL